MTEILNLEPTAQEVNRLIGNITDDQLMEPTPCEGVVTAGLLNHVLGLSQAFAAAARKEEPSSENQAPDLTDTALTPEWRQLVPSAVSAMAEAWKSPSAWEGKAEAGGVTMEAAEMGTVALDELVLHGWDLAKATGQQFRCDETSAAVIFEFSKAVAAEGGWGIFGPAVAVDGDAPIIDQAAGNAGRNPSWRP